VRRARHGLTLDEIVSGYARGWFPMDDGFSREVPWYAPDPRAVFDLDPHSLERTRRVVRRSLRACGDWPLLVDGRFEEVVERCGRPRAPDDGVWLTPRMARLYGDLHAAGLAHSFEVWVDGRLAAGMVAVTIGAAAMLESMFHTVPHAGNVLVVKTLESLAAGGCRLCDIQLISEHTRRLGAREIPRRVYEERLRVALRQPLPSLPRSRMSRDEAPTSRA
jgi:leucyl/phenylalanyl-tRNA--protein transferase